MNPSEDPHIELMNRVPPYFRAEFNPNMVESLDTHDRDAFFNELSDWNMDSSQWVIKEVMCPTKACQFLLWLLHYDNCLGAACKYCDFIRPIYFSIHRFLSYPEATINKEVNVK